jgi:hypothetical protein
VQAIRLHGRPRVVHGKSSGIPVGHRLNGTVEAALQVFTYSVALRKARWIECSSLFAWPRWSDSSCGGLALWSHAVKERSIHERELPCRLAALACTLIRTLVQELVAE